MKIDWIPSEKTINEAKKVYRLWLLHTPIKEIQKLLNYHRTYIHALINLGKELEEKRGDK
jgi:hypothetical protein